MLWNAVHSSLKFNAFSTGPGGFNSYTSTLTHILHYAWWYSARNDVTTTHSGFTFTDSNFHLCCRHLRLWLPTYSFDCLILVRLYLVENDNRLLFSRHIYLFYLHQFWTNITTLSPTEHYQLQIDSFAVVHHGLTIDHLHVIFLHFSFSWCHLLTLYISTVFTFSKEIYLSPQNSHWIDS